jgi:hypothetical protein
MKTRALILALPLVALTACRENRASVQVQAICAPTSDCTFQATCDKVYIGYPIIDAALTDSLFLYIQVENQLPDNTNLGNGRVNTNDAHIDETVVTYEGPAIPQAVLKTNLRVPAAGTTVIGVEVIPSVLLPQAALQAFAPAGPPRDMVATLKLRGYYDDGSRFETGAFPIGVRVCQAAPGFTCAPVCPATKLYCPQGGQAPVSCVSPPT